jgi:hypothetical protein
MLALERLKFDLLISVTGPARLPPPGLLFP